MKDWKEYKFSDFVEINPKVALKSNQEYSFVEMKDLNESNKHCEPSQTRELKGGARFEEGDTLFARITPCLENGKICQVRNLINGVGYGSTEFLVFRGKKGISDSDFVFYLSRYDDVRNFAESNFDGTSGRQRVPKDAFNNLYLSLPPLPTQKAIATILSRLDAKIDLLHRQNQTLEQLAETMFRELIIRNEELGMGTWEKKLFEIGKIVCGKTPSKKVHTFFGGDIPFIKIPDMHGKTFVFETEDTLSIEGKRSQENKTIPAYSICVSCIATVGLVCLNYYESQTNQQVNSIIPNNSNDTYFLYLTLKSRVDDIKAMASGGTATDNLNTTDFSKIVVQYFDRNIIDSFNSKVAPLFNKIKSNSQQIKTLTQLRDSLLPQLMSGAVRVK